MHESTEAVRVLRRQSKFDSDYRLGTVDESPGTSRGDIPFYQHCFASITLWMSRILSWEWDAERTDIWPKLSDL